MAWIRHLLVTEKVSPDGLKPSTHGLKVPIGNTSAVTLDHQIKAELTTSETISLIPRIGTQPSSLLTLAISAIKMAGSPERLSTLVKGVDLPVALSKAAKTSLTEYPVPLPRL